MSAANLVVLSATDSTNALARRLLARVPAASTPVPTALVAWSQSGGRGRLGRSWSSGPGAGAWVSLWIPLTRLDRLSLLPILLPVTLCETLGKLGLEGCRLRWPNDLVVDGRKLGGVLIETVISGERPRAAILGFGVNYLAPAPKSVSRPTVGVRELLSPAPTVGQMTRRLVSDVLVAVLGAPEAEPSAVIESYRRLSVHEPGEHLVCNLPRGTLEGDFEGFDARGFLRLRAGGEVCTISSGELIES